MRELQTEGERMACLQGEADHTDQLLLEAAHLTVEKETERDTAARLYGRPSR